MVGAFIHSYILAQLLYLSHGLPVHTEHTTKCSCAALLSKGIKGARTSGHGGGLLVLRFVCLVGWLFVRGYWPANTASTPYLYINGSNMVYGTASVLPVEYAGR